MLNVIKRTLEILTVLNNAWDLCCWLDCDLVLPTYKIWNQNDKFKQSIRVGGTDNIIAPMLRHMSVKRTYAVLLSSSPGLFTVAIRTNSCPCRLGSVPSLSLSERWPLQCTFPCPQSKPDLPVIQPKAQSLYRLSEAFRLKLVDSNHTKTKDLHNLPAAAVWYLLRL